MQIAPAQDNEASAKDVLARVGLEFLTKLPQDLYIPPGALKVILEAFEGPMDLLLYLIKKQNIDVLNIPIAELTRQYISYVDLMQELQLELAAEYLVMAAMLAEIKSRMLLPRPASVDGEEGEDPRAELVRRLQEYERFREAAINLDQLPRMERDVFAAEALQPVMELETSYPELDFTEILKAMADVMNRAKLYTRHEVAPEVLSIRERMTLVLERVKTDEFTPFGDLFTPEEGRMGVVVTLIAILELIRLAALELVQSEPFAPLYVKAKGAPDQLQSEIKDSDIDE